MDQTNVKITQIQTQKNVQNLIRARKKETKYTWMRLRDDDSPP